MGLFWSVLSRTCVENLQALFRLTPRLPVRSPARAGRRRVARHAPPTRARRVQDVWCTLGFMMIVADFIIVLILLLMFIFAVTVIAHLRTGTPYGGSPAAVSAEMLRLARLRGTEIVYDIGAGDGRLLIHAKKMYPNIRAIGYENALGVWMAGKLRILLSGLSIRFLCRDALKANFRDADVIFLYLIPEMMQKLETKFDAELRPGTRVVSHAFQFHGKNPIEESKAAGWVREKKVYLYQW